MLTYVDDEGNPGVVDIGREEDVTARSVLPSGAARLTNPSVAIRGGTKSSRMALAKRLAAELDSEYTISITDRSVRDPGSREMIWLDSGGPVWSDLLIYVGSNDSAMPTLFIGGPRLARNRSLDPDFMPTIALIGSEGRPDSWTGPCFPLDSSDEIAQFLIDYFRRSSPRLFGVVLTGGKSTRMGTDKASINYHGRPQAEIACDLLAQRCDEVCVSIARSDSGHGTQLMTAMAGQSPVGAPQTLADRFVGFGPAGGILTALHERSDAAWLVLGCDLPLMTGADLDQLIAKRDPLRPATAFASPDGHLPEPLAAIYEPQMRLHFHSAFACGVFCPRKILNRTNTRLVIPKRAEAVLNANTLGDRRRVEELISEASRSSTAGRSIRRRSRVCPETGA